MNRRWIAAAAVGALLVVALGAGAVMAQTGGSAPGNTFLDRVAQKLGIESPKLQDAITSTRNEDIDAKVQSGDLTQKQADALKQRAAAAPGFGDRSEFRGGKGPGGPMFGFGLPESAQKLADFLGISPDELKTELQADNATLATVAAAHGKSADDLKAFISDSVKAKVDAAVQNGDLTQKSADQVTSRLTARLDDLINGKHGHRFGPGHGRGPAFGKRGAPGGDGTAPDTTPSAPAPQSGPSSGGVFGF